MGMDITCADDMNLESRPRRSVSQVLVAAFDLW